VCSGLELKFNEKNPISTTQGMPSPGGDRLAVAAQEAGRFFSDSTYAVLCIGQQVVVIIIKIIIGGKRYVGISQDSGLKKGYQTYLTEEIRDMSGSP
jgi:hypothetical protein